MDNGTLQKTSLVEHDTAADAVVALLPRTDRDIHSNTGSHQRAWQVSARGGPSQNGKESRCDAPVLPLRFLSERLQSEVLRHGVGVAESTALHQLTHVPSRHSHSTHRREHHSPQPSTTDLPLSIMLSPDT